MVRNLASATPYRALAIPLTAGIAYSWGTLLTQAPGTALTLRSAAIVVIKAKRLVPTRHPTAWATEAQRNQSKEEPE